MKLYTIRAKFYLLLLLSFILFFTSCKEQTTAPINSKTKDISSPTKTSAKPLEGSFKTYWYAGKAEITSYKLEQVRYGEIRDGRAVLVYVTEDFLPVEQVKSDDPNKENISILKLNATKKFNTGIYPYSIMQSSFYPVANNQHALKVSASIQEWCGQTYMQLNNRSDFEVRLHSYFQSEGDQNFHLEKTILENELWNQLRIDPKSLPVGNLEIIPAFEYLRLKHKNLKAYAAEANLEQGTYRIYYPDLKRELTIHFNPDFPFDISSWEETYPDGGEILSTKATKLKTLKTDYWNKNSNAFERLRDSLQI